MIPINSHQILSNNFLNLAEARLSLVTKIIIAPDFKHCQMNGKIHFLFSTLNVILVFVVHYVIISLVSFTHLQYYKSKHS